MYLCVFVYLCVVCGCVNECIVSMYVCKFNYVCVCVACVFVCSMCVFVYTYNNTYAKTQTQTII